MIVWRGAGELGVTAHDAVPAVHADLIDIGVRVSFRHPLVRSAAYGAAALDDRQAAHRALALVTDPEVDPARRAWHRALGSPGPDEDIAEELRHSADRARARGGFAAAGALLERSVALTADPTRRAARVLAAAEAHLEAGSFAVAGSLLASAEVTPSDELQRAQADLLRARLAVFGGDAGSAPELLLGTARRLEQIDGDFAAAVYLQAIAATSLVGGLSRAVGIGDVARAAVEYAQTHASVSNEWLVAGLARVSVDGPAAAAPALRRALEMPLGDAFGAHTFQLLGYQLCAATVLWDIDAFRRVTSLQVAATRDVGALSQLPGALNVLAQGQVLIGELDAAASSIAEAREIYQATGNNLLPSVAALLAGLRGGDAAARVIEEQAATARVAGLGLALKSAEWATATLHNGAGRYEDALAASTRAMQYPWEFNSQLFFHEHVEAAVRCGQPELAASTIERLGETVETSDSDWATGIQCRSQALLPGAANAEDLFRAAIECLGNTPIRPELARAHLLYGEWLRRENRRVDAREQLRAAHDLFVAMGIDGFAERTRHELLATGETVRKRRADTFDELTPQEAHIARLAADGYTNVEIGGQLFISARTVEWHLRKVFTKLGVSSRRDLRSVQRVASPA
jgi:DNA-binding CsgD family transcriptional regulator/tetratricopeptide (TPR) repeat protein